jgi:predicted nuclease of predicted toxin-antitoxin system
MKTILIDHDIEGQGNFLWGTLVKEGWLSLVSIEFMTFQDVGLPFESNDREVWRFAQANDMILALA